MKTNSLEFLACPSCHGALSLQGMHDDPIRTGSLLCAGCSRSFAVRNAIPFFIEPEELSGANHRFARLYDWFSWGYRAFSKIAFAYIGMKEETARREITDRLEPRRGRVLEVSIGPGVNLPYMVGRPDVGEIFGVDISFGQLQRCQAYLRKKDWDAELFLGNAEQLPFQDNTFESVFHVGGINFFNDKTAAIAEMIRVAKPGTRILICDETEKGARAYERFLPSFKRTVGKQREAVAAPAALVPPEMLDLQVSDVWKGWMYCLEFRKP
jgi:ubiquinone/menaquinone biosynthesis C-methylase UbiE